MNNDERILGLKKQVEAKKEMLSKCKKTFASHTNLIIEWRGEKKNLNVLGYNELIMLGSELENINTYCCNHNYKDISISGYSISDWLLDIDQKIELISIRHEEEELKKMEQKLNKMLSEDKKTELELNDIEALLK